MGSQEKHEAKLEFREGWGRGVQSKKKSIMGGTDIFWNHTLQQILGLSSGTAAHCPFVSLLSWRFC